ncbi:MAG: SDR family oxidoreductase [Microscillaceae bacterium]|nr:SDR family oxidoreductase [Microscillaceae bacterium]MDW8461657.1 SDR family oxidoreductase [Cytophagales bacterium]
MQGKNIFITGIANGIGKATALLFAQKGWLVSGVDLDEQALQKLRTELASKALFIQKADICNETEMQAVFNSLAQQTSHQLNVLVNNAGILRMGFFENIPLAEQKRMIEVNFWGMVNTTYWALPLLKNTPHAQIINLSSASAIYGVPEFCVYAATKHAVRGFTEGLEIEFSRLNIQVSDIMPPFVNTDMLNKAPYKAWAVEKMGIHIQPHEIAQKIWHAVQKHKTHHIVTLKLKMLNFLGNLFPFIRKPLMTRLTMPK